MQFTYHQKDDGRLKASDTGGGGGPVLGTVTTNGACLGISSWWIIKRSQGEDFWTWFGPPKSAAPTGAVNGKAGEPMQVIKDMMNAQKFILDPIGVGGTGGSITAVDDAVTDYIVAKSNNRLVTKGGVWEIFGPVPWNQLAEVATVNPGYAFIGWQMTGWGGHAVAARILGNGSIEWMDPNIGEVEITDKAALKQWFATACSGSGGTYGPAPLTRVSIQVFEPTLPDTRLPPATKKLHEM